MTAETILIPGFKVRNASTEVTTASGETIVIAGLLELSDSEITALRHSLAQHLAG